MDAASRRAWTEVVTAEDYDRHMAAIGQAAATAELLMNLLGQIPPSPRRRVLLLGGGTGWMFEHADVSPLVRVRLTVTDINAGFLELLRRRARSRGIEPEIVVDDLEDTRLAPGREVVLASLLLEHIDWRKGVAAIARLSPRSVVLVIQENPPGMSTSVTPGRTLPDSIARASLISSSRLVPRTELVAEFEGRGYRLIVEERRAVADSKTMVGLLFARAPTAPARGSRRGQLPSKRARTLSASTVAHRLGTPGGSSRKGNTGPGKS